jgi:hypothetical protein
MSSAVKLVEAALHPPAGRALQPHNSKIPACIALRTTPTSQLLCLLLPAHRACCLSSHSPPPGGYVAPAGFLLHRVVQKDTALRPIRKTEKPKNRKNTCPAIILAGAWQLTKTTISSALWVVSGRWPLSDAPWTRPQQATAPFCPCPFSSPHPPEPLPSHTTQALPE